MDLYVALKDRIDGRRTVILGVFSSEPRARAACQSDLAEESVDQPDALIWHGDSAEGNNVEYTVRLVDLDEPTYC